MYIFSLAIEIYSLHVGVEGPREGLMTKHHVGVARDQGMNRHAYTTHFTNNLYMLSVINILTTTGTLAQYVDRLKRVYQNTSRPATWIPLPNCKHIKLAMTKEKGVRHEQEPDEEIVEHIVKGEGEISWV